MSRSTNRSHDKYCTSIKERIANRTENLIEAQMPVVMPILILYDAKQARNPLLSRPWLGHLASAALPHDAESL